MIGFLKGVIHTLSPHPPRVVLIAGFVGYEVYLPAYVYETIVADGMDSGSLAEFEVYYHVTDRQPRPSLVGFLNAAEREFFEKMIEVEGIGPMKAASALAVPPSTIAQAIETEDAATLVQLPGIGARAAQKIIATLKGKVSALAFPAAVDVHPGAHVVLSEIQLAAVAGLVTLGYKNAEARQSVIEASKNKAAADIQTLLREVFRAQASQKS